MLAQHRVQAWFYEKEHDEELTRRRGASESRSAEAPERNVLPTAVVITENHRFSVQFPSSAALGPQASAWPHFRVFTPRGPKCMLAHGFAGSSRSPARGPSGAGCRPFVDFRIASPLASEMKYQNVCVEGFGYTLAEEIVTSEEIETWLKPLYDRLRLSPGRLEMLTGIRQRRFWPRGELPSQKSVESAARALQAASVDPREIGCLIHASVCRDFLEPATACTVHHRLGLPHECLIYDVSNACLGILDGIVQVANMIELGQIRAGLVVGTEGGRQLVETTIARLNADTTLGRNELKRAIASLTIGSGSVGRAVDAPRFEPHAKPLARRHGPHRHALSRPVP